MFWVVRSGLPGRAGLVPSSGGHLARLPRRSFRGLTRFMSPIRPRHRPPIDCELGHGSVQTLQSHSSGMLYPIWGAAYASASWIRALRLSGIKRPESVTLVFTCRTLNPANVCTGSIERSGDTFALTEEASATHNASSTRGNSVGVKRRLFTKARGNTSIAVDPGLLT